VNRIRLFSVLFLSVVLCSAVLPVNAEPGRILFVDTAEQGKSYLAVMNADGNGKTRLTPPFLNIVCPRFCAATGMIGFTHKKADMSSEVYLIKKEGDKLEKAFDGVNLEGFSPDGKSLLYTTADADSALYIYSFESKRSIKISDKYKVTAADWSPNGEWIACSILGDAGTNDLLVISTVAQGIERLTDTPKVDESFPVWASDSRRLAFISNERGMNYVDYIDVVTKKTDSPMIVGMYPRWSLDHQWLTFEAGRQIGVARANGLESKPIGRGRCPTWMK